MSNDILTVEELIERETAALPQMQILDARTQWAKEMARSVLDQMPSPEKEDAITVDDQLAAVEAVLERLAPGSFFTDDMALRAVEWSKTLPVELTVDFMRRALPLLPDSAKDSIKAFTNGMPQGLFTE